MDTSKLEQAARLEETARSLRKQAFDERPLPDHWRVGDRVRYIRDKEHCCDAGELGVIVEVSTECAEKSADQPQVFWTRPDAWARTLGGTSRFWTTPEDVELVEKTRSDSDAVGQSDGA